MRQFILSIILVLSFQAIAEPAAAQIDPRFGDGGWCIPIRGTFNSECIYESPESACAATVEDFYPGRSFLWIETNVKSVSNASCVIDVQEARRVWLYIGTPSVTRYCPSGFSYSGGICSPIHQQICETCDSGGTRFQAGNPIDVQTGIKFQSFEDFSTADGRFKLTRHYSSRPYGSVMRVSNHGLLGRGWSMEEFPRMLSTFTPSSNNRNATFFLPNSRAARVSCGTGLICDQTTDYRSGGDGSGVVSINRENSTFDGDFSIPHDEIPVSDSRGITYIFKTELQGDKIYGRIIRAEYPGGYSVSYETDFVTDNVQVGTGFQELTKPRYVLKSKTDNFGRSMTFEYNTRNWSETLPDGSLVFKPLYRGGALINRPANQIGNIKTVTLPDGGRLEFKYTATTPDGLKYGLDERLERMERYGPSDNLIDEETYLYETENLAYGLTGIIDALGVRYATWSYNQYGLAESSELADGLNKYTLDYQIGGNTSVAPPSNRIVVTNPLGRQTNYDTSLFSRYIGEARGQASANVPADELKTRNSSRTDREGNTTSTSRDYRGWPTRTVQASGTSTAVTTNIEWHPVFRLPVRRVEPGLTTDYTYDSAGRLLSMTQTDTSANAAAPRVWGFTHVGPNVSSVDGPLPGTSDTQFYSYDAEKLISITDELGFVTDITAHNTVGAPARIVDPNGNATRLVYDAKHRLAEIIESDGNLNASTRLTYNINDLLTGVTQPNGSALIFEYDDARRLMAITNSVGERIDYTRNAMGGILSTKISRSGQGNLIDFQINQVTDEINRVIKTTTIGGASGFNSETTLGYDRANNLTSITDPRANTWQQSYDGLNRLVKEIDPLGAQTDYGLNAQTDARNPLTSVKDARNVTTNYVRNGFGEVIREVSLEAGITEYTRDERGLVTQMTDARGVVTNYTYDAAGRLLTETYPSEAAADITYTYDQGPNGIGELTSVTEGFGSTSYTYDSLGHMSSMTRSINGQSYTTAYTYDLAGEVLTETYPSGRTIRMNRDAAARVVGIEAQGPGETSFTPILSNVTYAAFGPLTGAEFADGHSLDISYDSAYRAKSLRRTTDTASLMDITFEHDASGNILAMNDNVRPERSQSFTYDPVSRLTSAENMGLEGYGSIGYDYNLGGDRIARNYTPIGGELQAQVYNYEAGTARLTDVTSAGSTLRLFGYDASGQVISDTRSDDVITSLFDYGLNARGRLVSVTEDGIVAATYTYDMSEQRIVKAVAGEAAIHYHYDGEGRLISETDAATGTTLREYIWLGLTPIASYGSSYDPEDPVNDNCNPVFREGLAQKLLDRQDRLALVQERIGVVSGNLDDRTARQATVAARKAELEAILAGVPATNVIRIDALTARIANLDTRLTTLATAIDRLTTRLPELAARETRLIEAIARISARIERLNTICDDPNTPPPANMTGGETGNNVITLSFLHSDHLGRPKFATREDGTVSWDGGITTPFGMQITALAAQTQALMFPGQYEDAETTGAGVTLSHNWHRTYDPTLGRYLQSDPIGLAGGLNRYAYVGGNPINEIDPTGLLLDPKTAAALAAVDGPFPVGDALAISAMSFTAGQKLYDITCGEDDDNDDECKKEIGKARAQYHKLTNKRIPQYLNSLTPDFNHFRSIGELQRALQKTLNRIRKKCKMLPPEFDEWQRAANDVIRPRH